MRALVALLLVLGLTTCSPITRVKVATVVGVTVGATYAAKCEFCTGDVAFNGPVYGLAAALVTWGLLEVTALGIRIKADKMTEDARDERWWAERDERNAEADRKIDDTVREEQRQNYEMLEKVRRGEPCPDCPSEEELREKIENNSAYFKDKLDQRIHDLNGDSARAATEANEEREKASRDAADARERSRSEATGAESGGGANAAETARKEAAAEIARKARAEADAEETARKAKAAADAAESARQAEAARKAQDESRAKAACLNRCEDARSSCIRACPANPPCNKSYCPEEERNRCLGSCSAAYSSCWKTCEPDWNTHGKTKAE